MNIIMLRVRLNLLCFIIMYKISCPMQQLNLGLNIFLPVGTSMLTMIMFSVYLLACLNNILQNVGDNFYHILNGFCLLHLYRWIVKVLLLNTGKGL